MNAFLDILTVAVVIAGVAAFFYAWFRLLKTSVEKLFSWRDGISMAAIALATVAVFLRFVMPAFWGSDFGDQVRFADKWAAVSLKICALGLLVTFFGRPRLIAPIGIACVGTAVFWVMSTIP